jgi:putative addiction module component (TIGR02574 family)
MAASKKLWAEAMELSPADRLQLAHDLLSSVDDEADPDAEAAWTTEIERRAREVLEGTVVLADAREVHAGVRASLRARRDAKG